MPNQLSGSFVGFLSVTPPPCLCPPLSTPISTSSTAPPGSGSPVCGLLLRGWFSPGSLPQLSTPSSLLLYKAQQNTLPSSNAYMGMGHKIMQCLSPCKRGLTAVCLETLKTAPDVWSLSAVSSSSRLAGSRSTSTRHVAVMTLS